MIPSFKSFPPLKNVYAKVEKLKYFHILNFPINNILKGGEKHCSFPMPFNYTYI